MTHFADGTPYTYGPVEHLGERLVLVDSDGSELAAVEVTTVDVVPLREVTWECAGAREGEGFEFREQRRVEPLRYWAKAGHDDIDGDTEIYCLCLQLCP